MVLVRKMASQWQRLVAAPGQIGAMIFALLSFLAADRLENMLAAIGSRDVL